MSVALEVADLEGMGLKDGRMSVGQDMLGTDEDLDNFEERWRDQRGRRLDVQRWTRTRHGACQAGADEAQKACPSSSTVVPIVVDGFKPCAWL
jgi:hypothetical protein